MEGPAGVPEATQYTCPDCNPPSNFDSKRKLNLHMNRKHIFVPCSNGCGRMFPKARSDNRKRHESICNGLGQNGKPVRLKKPRKPKRAYTDRQRIQIVHKFQEFHEQNPVLTAGEALKRYLKHVGINKKQWKNFKVVWTRNQQKGRVYNNKQVSAISVRKQKTTRSTHTGRKPTTITPKLDRFLKSLVTFLRGPKPDGRDEDEKTQDDEKAPEPPEPLEPIVVKEDDTMSLSLSETWDERAVREAVESVDRIDLTKPTPIPKTPSKRVVNCRVFTLVWQLRLRFPKIFAQRSVTAWYTAISRWCKRNGLSLRRVNRKTILDKPALAAEIRALRAKTKDLIRTKHIQDSQILNLDETAMQIFNLESELARKLQNKDKTLLVRETKLE